MNAIPLAVDLDGTLVRSDTLHEAALRALREHPLALLKLPFWLLQGKAVLKQRLAALSRFDPSTLPYNYGLTRSRASRKINRWHQSPLVELEQQRHHLSKPSR